jgi:serine/threonine protein kinase
MSNATCFDPGTLQDYLLGKLSDEQSDAVAAHLEACLSCEATISQLDRASDTLTNGLRMPAAAPEPVTDDELQKALDRVQSLEPAAERRESSDESVNRSPVLRDYRLLEPLGSGGMGTVYKAVHTRLDRLVAVKLLPARRLGDEQAVARFQREMRVIGQLSHPSIVQATDAGEVDGTHFLVMEYVEGCDLNTLAKACGPLSIADACEITRQAALGLEYAHQQGIVHRDIKPSNLMLSSNSEGGGRKSELNELASHSAFRIPNSPFLKILDLGLALLSGEQAPVDELTTVGQLMGTLDYMAPEQLEDSHLVGPRADIYSLAATLFRLLTGTAPFAKEDRKTPLQKLRALATQSVTPIRERRADLPEALAAIIDRALRRDPAERFASMTEFAAALTPWCAGHDLAALAHTASENVVVRENPVGQVFKLSVPMSLPKSLNSSVRERPARSSSLPAGQVENLSHVPRRQTGLIALAVLFLAVLGVVITIQTNKGTLIVESVRDGVEVRVKKSGKTVERLEVSKTAKSTKFAAGKYEIEFVGGADGLTISNQQFTLKRGDVVVAKVVEVPTGMATKNPQIAEKRLSGVSSSPAERSEGTVIESDADARVRRSLATKISVKFKDTPLSDAVTEVAKKLAVEARLDAEAISEGEFPPDQPVNVNLANSTGEAVLAKLLHPLQLSWEIMDGTLVITTPVRANDRLTSKFYDVRDVLQRGLPSKRLVTAIEADTSGPWFSIDNEGGTIEFVTETLLIVRQTSKVHKEIAKFLTVLRGQLADPSEVATGTDDEKPNPAAKSIDQGLASHPDRAAETKYREALRTRVDLKFSDTSIIDGLEYLQEFASVPIWLDKPALEEEGLASDTPVTLTLSGVSLGTAFRFLLRRLNLTSFWDGTSIRVTTLGKAKEQFVSRSYPVGRSLPMIRKAARLRQEQDNKALKAFLDGGGLFDVPTLEKLSHRPCAGGWRDFALLESPQKLSRAESREPLGQAQWGKGQHTFGERGDSLDDRLHFQFGGGGIGGNANANGIGGGESLTPNQLAAGYFAELFALLTDASWMATDGEGGTLQLLGDVLIVRQTRPVHEQIEAVLRVLEQAAAGPLPKSPVEIRRPDYPFEADQTLRDKLSKPVEFEGQDTPLTDALQFLEDFTQTRILVDTEKLNEEAIASDTPITASLKNMPFQAALHRLLDPLQLVADVEEGLLVVTTKSASQERLVLKGYEIRDLIARGVEEQELLSGLESGTVGPWMNRDGEGGGLMVFADRLLFVKQTQQNHEEVEAFLRDLRSQLSEQPRQKPLAQVKPQQRPKISTPVAANNPGTTRPTTPAQPANDPKQPRYDGKSFDEWLTVLDVERSPARLADAFQALRLLYQDHQAEIVANRVLTVFRLASPNASFGDNRSILNDAMETLNALPTKVVQTAAANELASGNTRSRKFVFHHALGWRSETSISAPQLPKAVLAVSHDSDAAIRASALQWLNRLPRQGVGSEAIPEATQRFREALNDKAPEVSYWAAYSLLDSEPDTAAVIETLKRLIGSPAQTANLTEVSPLQGEALKLVAVMGPRAAVAAPDIAPFLLLRDSADGQRGIHIGQSGNGPGSNAIQLSIKSLAALTLARMGKAAASTLPTIEEALKEFSNLPRSGLESPTRVFGGSGNFGFGGGSPATRGGIRIGQVTFLELLIAAKARIEDRPAPEPQTKPAEVKLDDTLPVQAMLKLLHTEQALLEERYGHGAERPELRELDQKLKAVEEEFNALWKLYNEQRKNSSRRPTGSPFGAKADDGQS